MPTRSALEPGPLLRDAVLLALARVEAIQGRLAAWRTEDEAALRDEAARFLGQQIDAANILSGSAERLTRGIQLVPFLEPGGPFGPAWAGHPFASPAMQASYNLREPDLTKALARLMGPDAGWRGSQRAVSFLRILTEQAGAHVVREALTDQTRPTVSPEHMVVAARRRPLEGASQRSRIDLLFEWPFGTDGQRCVVVVEAKLGAVVSGGQLVPYREEAQRRAKGGPAALILLTAEVDAAERRNRSWSAVRWFGLLRRWEGLLAEAGDDDPEFARVRAHLWKHILPA